MLIYGALGSCIVTGLPGASGAGAHSVSSTQLMPIVVRIDTKCDDDVEQPVEIGVGRSSETGWICRGYGKPGEKRCCDARDLRETVTGNARNWRAIVSGV